MQFLNGQLQGKYEHYTAGMVVPGPDGSVVYTNRGRNEPQTTSSSIIAPPAA